MSAIIVGRFWTSVGGRALFLQGKSNIDNGQVKPADLRCVSQWYEARGWEIFPYQMEVWQAHAAGYSGLIHSATGTGKTLAAWFAVLLAQGGLTAASRNGKPRAGPATDPATTVPITVLWITPLRALAIDTRQNLERVVLDLHIPWSVGLRSGDTTAGERTRQRKRLPSALVTTPESLSLLLSYTETAVQLRGVQAIVVDEWHELLGSKRGVQLQLCLAHLQASNPRLQLWGLSATIGNLREAAAVLLGATRRARVINGNIHKKVRITGMIPADISRFPWAGHTGLQGVGEVIDVIAGSASTLLFTNTRAQAERWFEALTERCPEWLGQIALHHGSLDAKLRVKVEDLLRRGELKCVVATSSLDLGVDFSPVDQVIQVGSPKGVARLLQRAGRSGHQPDGISAVYCVPTHALELLEIAAARAAAADQQIEARQPPTLCLDVLCQHLVTLALAGGVDVAQVLEEARRTHAFAELSDRAWDWVVDFTTSGGPALAAYPQYQRLQYDRADGLFHIASPTLAQRHRMAIGTITSDASLRVQFHSGGYLGTIEESFISRLKPGDVFLFAGRRLALVRVREMTAQVRLASGKRPAVPRWSGGRLPLSSELGLSVLRQFERYGEGKIDSPELAAAAPLLALQAERSSLPTRGELLIERASSREGISLFFYPFAGRLVHEGLAALFAWRLSQRQAITFSYAVNDYGFELLSRDDVPFSASHFKSLLSLQNLTADVLQAINATEMARRQFRDIARIAGLVFQGYPGAKKSKRQVQASSGLIYDVLTEYDPDNFLLTQAERELLESQFELTRLAAALQSLQQKSLVMHQTLKLTPLALPLWADRLRARLSSESWLARVTKMQQSLVDAAAAPPRKRRGAGAD